MFDADDSRHAPPQGRKPGAATRPGYWSRAAAIAEEINRYLVVLAIGLAALDLTGYIALNAPPLVVEEGPSVQSSPLSTPDLSFVPD